MAYRNYSTAVSHIVDATGQGDFTAVGTAIAAAVSGETIFIRPGTYTENITLKAGVNLSAYICDSITPNVVIHGKCTFTTAGTISFSGINLQTNGDFFLAVTGSAASIINLYGCFLTCSDHTGISYTSSSSSSHITMSGCSGDLLTTGIALWDSSSPGVVDIDTSTFGNTGGSSTDTTNSSGIAAIYNSIISSPLACSSTGIITIFNSVLDTSAQNATTFAMTGTGTSVAYHCSFSAGSASSITIGAGSILGLVNGIIISSNTHTITGAGTLNYAFIAFPGSSAGHNVTTENAIPVI